MVAPRRRLSPPPLPPASGSSPAPSADDAGDLRTLWWLRVGLLLSMVLPWALFAGVAVYSHEGALRSAERRMDRLAGVAHEHALKLFETSDLLIRQVNLATRDLGADELRQHDRQVGDMMRSLTQGLEQVQGLWIIDAQGEAAVSSRMAPVPRFNVARFPVFVSHREHAGQVILTPPRRGLVTGEVFFDLSRRRETADGRFDGITLVGLHPSYFTHFYKELADAERGVVLTLMHEDGRIIARWPAPSDPGAKLSVPAEVLRQMRGRFADVSELDGVPRLGAWQRVGAYPAYVFASTERHAALAGWRRDMLVLAAFVLPLSLGLALISFQALRRTRKHIEAARALRIEHGERQRVEAALRQSQKLEAMGHLTGGVAHDFNNLLMVVNLNVTLLRQRLRDAAHERPLQAIERSVAAGKKLTRQLLAFSRRQPLLPRVLDLDALLPSLLDLIRPALGSRVTLEGRVAPGTRPVRVDSGELELALINLAVNARDAMPKGGQVRIDVHEAGGFVEIAFADSGMGIDPKDLERVFEPFFTTKPVGSGTGLGLAQVYGLCARAGGSARVDSVHGAGTTVTLRLPAVDAAPDAGGPGSPPAPSLETLALRVLLVEDNADIASATRELLQEAGCEVVHVPQPAAALQVLARDGAFDVVLSDIVMPGGMDGLQLCDQLRRSHPQLPVVLMTGYAEKLGEAEAQGLVVLPKPFDPALLLRTLREQVQAGNLFSPAG